MKWHQIKVFLILVWVLSIFPSMLLADTNVSTKDVAVRKLGVSWNMAEDRKIENNGGIYEPEGLDKYMKRLVEGLSAKIDQVIAQNERIEKKLNKLVPGDRNNTGTLISQGENKKQR